MKLSARQILDFRRKFTLLCLSTPRDFRELISSNCHFICSVFLGNGKRRDEKVSPGVC